MTLLLTLCEHIRYGIYDCLDDRDLKRLHVLFPDDIEQYIVEGKLKHKVAGFYFAAGVKLKLLEDVLQLDMVDMAIEESIFFAFCDVCHEPVNFVDYIRNNNCQKIDNDEVDEYHRYDEDMYEYINKRTGKTFSRFMDFVCECCEDCS